MGSRRGACGVCRPCGSTCLLDLAFDVHVRWLGFGPLRASHFSRHEVPQGTSTCCIPVLGSVVVCRFLPRFVVGRWGGCVLAVPGWEVVAGVSGWPFAGESPGLLFLLFAGEAGGVSPSEWVGDVGVDWSCRSAFFFVGLSIPRPCMATTPLGVGDGLVSPSLFLFLGVV